MKQNRRVNNAIKRESIRDKKSDVRLNRVRVNKIIKEEIIYTLFGGIKITSTNRMRKRGVRISTFLCLFIFFQLNLSSQ